MGDTERSTYCRLSRSRPISPPSSEYRPSLDNDSSPKIIASASDPSISPLQPIAPLSPPLSPATALSLQGIVSRLQPLCDGKSRSCIINGVSQELYDQLDDYAQSAEDLPGLQAMHRDLHDGVLIVSYPTMGHEVIVNVFVELARNNHLYPPLYNGSRIFPGGSADVILSQGIKSPDYSLYERRKNGVVKTKPTIVWEVAYSESASKLALDCARHLCLSRGQVRLAVAVDIVHQDKSSRPRILKSVTWSHWEIDLNSWSPVEEGSHDWWNGELDDTQPERGDAAPSEEYVQPPAIAFRAVISSGEQKFQIRAFQTKVYKIFPQSDMEDIHILYRHLYRDPKAEDEDKVVITFHPSEILAVIKEHEEQQREVDEETKKRKSQPIAEEFADMSRRKRRCNAQ